MSFVEVQWLASAGKVEEARARFTELVQSLPNQKRNQQQISFFEFDLLMAEQNYEEALRTIDELHREYLPFEDSLSHKEFCQSIRYRWGYALGSVGKYEEAQRVLEPLWKAGFEMRVEAYLYMGLGYFAQRAFESARDCLLKCVGGSNEIEPYARFYLGVSYFELGYFRKSLAEFMFCSGRRGDLREKKQELSQWIKACESKLVDS